LDVGIHPLDAALFVADAVAVAVKDVQMIRHGGLDIDTEAHAELRSARHRAITLDLRVSSLHFTAMNTVYRFEHAILTHDIFGEGALWVAPVFGPARRYKLEGDGPDYPRTAAQVLNAHWCQFLHGVRDGIPNYTSASTTAVTSSLLGQLYEG
jgi:hypothetical protein